MLRISRPRGAGKTTEIVKWLLENDKRILVVQNQFLKMDIIKRFRVPQHRVMTMKSLDYAIRGLSPTTEFGIDDVEYIKEKDFNEIKHFYKLGAYTHTE